MRSAPDSVYNAGEKDQRGPSKCQRGGKTEIIPLASDVPGSVPRAIHTRHFYAQRTERRYLPSSPPVPATKRIPEVQPG